ncbi:hypothetical protein Hanom_Chr08g00736211 [Helianthus anomalus]
MSAQVERFRIDTDFVSQVQERYQALAVEVETSHAKAQAKQAELEEREDQLRKLQQQCDCLVTERNKLTQSSAADQGCLNEAENALENWLITNGLVGAFEYLRQSGSFTALLDRLSAAAYQSGHHDGGHTADALEAVRNDPLPAHADLTKHIAEDDVDALRLMLEQVEESEEEEVFSFTFVMYIVLQIFSITTVLLGFCAST